MKQEIIRLWSDCNQKCLFCNQEDEIKKKEKREILFELLSFKKKWVERLVISWWEPTLFKHELFFTIETAKKLRFKDIELQSNAVLLHDINFVKEMKNIWLISSMISLHSHNSKTSDYLTQANTTFKKTIEWIENLIWEWINTSLNIVINKQNYKDILNQIIFINENIIWFKDVSLSIVVPWKLTIKNNLLPKYETISKHLIEAYDYCIANNIKFQNPWCWIPICFVKDYYKYSLEYNNYKSWNIYDELVLEKNKKNKIKSNKCKKCVFDKYCLWLWKWYVELYWFENLKPIISL